jgi:hypothetical protein
MNFMGLRDVRKNTSTSAEMPGRKSEARFITGPKYLKDDWRNYDNISMD